MLQFDSSQIPPVECAAGVCQEGVCPGRMTFAAASLSYLVAPSHACRSEVWSLGLVSLAMDVGLLIFPDAEQLLCPLEVQVCLLVPF